MQEARIVESFNLCASDLLTPSAICLACAILSLSAFNCPEIVSFHAFIFSLFFSEMLSRLSRIELAVRMLLTVFVTEDELFS